jgi:hypothetical protein
MVLIESDAVRRQVLAAALRDAGIAVIAVGSIAELERWPRGEVVVTESRQFTPWWREVEAAHVVVLADTAADGHRCCRGGAALSLSRQCPPGRLIAAALSLGAHSLAGLAVRPTFGTVSFGRPSLVH